MAAQQRPLRSPGKLFWRTLSVAVVLSVLPQFAAAAPPEPTEAERMYQRLKDAESHRDQLLADRWHKLVRQRQWVDSSGKHKTYARYVDHDPNLQWVKLSVTVKQGDQVTYREGNVPLARLGKSEQALVKRIAIVRKDVEAALADAPGENGLAGEGAREYPGEEPFERGLEGRPEMTVPPGGEIPLPAEGAPAEMPPLPPMAGEPWRTDFTAFAAQLSSTRGEDGSLALNWGELLALKAVHDQERTLAMLKALPAAQRPGPLLFQQGFAYGWARSGLGEVAWTAALGGAGDATAEGLTHDLQLPEPFKLSLLPDPDYPGDNARFGRGEPVQFIGRFAELGGFGDAPHIKLLVRLPSDQRTGRESGGSELSTTAPGRPDPYLDPK